MTRLATLEVIVVAAWLGAAILTAAAVAPAAFRVLPSRTLAGALVGEVLPVIFVGGIVVAIAAMFLEMRAGNGGWRLTLAAPFIAMIIACVVAQFVIGPKIETVRAAIGGAVDALDASDPRRVQFGRLHGFSVLWMGVAMVAAAWSLLTKFLSKSS